MRDPHVVALRYRLETDPTVTFDNPPPLVRETASFRLQLADDVVVFEMREHYASEHDARVYVEPYLRAWELDAALLNGRREIKFTFATAEIIDRDPPPPGSHQLIALAGIVSAEAFGSATLRVTRRQYPEPPTQLQISPDVETLWSRYSGYLEGREPLAAMAYFCLTLIEEKSMEGKIRKREDKKRQAAAKLFSIDECVLAKLGKITAYVGDRQSARKLDSKSELRAYTGAEIAWIEATVKVFI